MRTEPLIPGAETKPTGVGLKIRKASEQLAQDIGRELNGDEGVAEYNPIEMADQAQRAVDLISRDSSLAERIAMADPTAAAPEGLRPMSVFVALEKDAMANRDADLMLRLSTSDLARQGSRAGQDLRALAERNPDSPVVAIQKIADVRAKAAEKKYGPVKEAKASVQEQAKRAVREAAPKMDAWEKFIDGLKC
jgi:hypothetical protein